MVLALLVLLMCDNACDTSGWQRGASGLVFVFFSVRMTGYVVVNVYFSCCLWVEGSMSHHVSEGEWFSSGCGVRGFLPFHSWRLPPPGLLEWGISPTLSVASCFAQWCPSYALLSPVGAGALQQLTFLLTGAVCCLWKAEADGADSLGLNDTCVLPASPLPLFKDLSS